MADCCRYCSEESALFVERFANGSRLAKLHDVGVARQQPVVQDLPLGGPVQVGAAAGDKLDGHLLARAAVVRQLHKARGACRL